MTNPSDSDSQLENTPINDIEQPSVIDDEVVANPSDSNSQLGNNPQNSSTIDISQKVGENLGQILGQAIDSVIVNTLNIFQGHAETALEPQTNPIVSGENPYKGLEAFEEEDRDRFFGRDAEIRGENGLLKRFQSLRDDQDAIRILPVYGASGSGKSSLVKAGLVPILRDGLKEGDRIVLMKPSEDPIGELAKALAHEMIDNPCPLEEIRDFKARLLEQNDYQEQDGSIKKGFDGLHQIINSAKQVKSLILVIDQFEEIYTYRPMPSQRDAFVENLLYAASHRSQRVSVILTMRIDFVGKTHEYPRLNKLFASPPGVYVPIMQRDQLVIAITEPAKRSGYDIDRAIVNLLIKDSQGQEGALPLLQFALMQIWEGLLQQPQVTPVETLEKIGGVGGALANKAQEVYDSLNDQEKQIARSIFLRLILLNDDNRATRCRVAIDHTEQSTREVIERFAHPKVRILVTSAPIENPKLETIEIAHEALIDNWEELKGWLNKNEKAKLQWQEIERLTKKWESHNISKDYLLEGHILRDALEFQKFVKDSKIREFDLSVLASELIAASRKKQKSDFIKRVATIFIFPTLILTPFIFHFGTLFIANQIIYKKGCDRNSMADFFLQYLIDFGGNKNLSKLNLCYENLSGINLSANRVNVIANVNFSTADLSGADLNNSFIKDVNFKDTILVFANFQSSTLVRVDLRTPYIQGLNLKGAKLIAPKLQGTSFRGINLKNTIFIKSDLSKVRDMTEYQLSQSKFCGSILPSSVSIPLDRDCSDPEVTKIVKMLKLW